MKPFWTTVVAIYPAFLLLCFAQSTVAQCDPDVSCSSRATSCSTNSSGGILCVCSSPRYSAATACAGCSTGYQGPTCDIAAPLSLCSGHGVPVFFFGSFRSCKCYSDSVHGSWTGAVCDRCAPDFYPAGVCSQYCSSAETCGGNGICSNAGTCVCNSTSEVAFTGPRCDQCSVAAYGFPLCRLQPYEGCVAATTNCSGHGRCTFDGHCECTGGYGIVSGQSSECASCAVGWTGTACDVPCNATTCGRGACNGTAAPTEPLHWCVCPIGFDPATACATCLRGYTGPNCTLACSTHSTLAQLPYHGSTVVPCACDSSPSRGRWVGDTCDSCAADWGPVGNCSRHCSNASCSFNGSYCDHRFVCRCPVAGYDPLTSCTLCLPGYFGASCEYFCDRSATCNSRGWCTFNSSMSACTCDAQFDSASNCTSCTAGYYNSDCSKFCNPTVLCHGRGTCSSIGDCQCASPFTGFYCTQCLPDFYPATLCSRHCVNTTTCSARGTCDPDGLCLCDYGYAGPSCSQCADGFVDNGAGVCTACSHGQWNSTQCLLRVGAGLRAGAGFVPSCTTCGGAMSPQTGCSLSEAGGMLLMDNMATSLDGPLYGVMSGTFVLLAADGLTADIHFTGVPPSRLAAIIGTQTLGFGEGLPRYLSLPCSDIISKVVEVEVILLRNRPGPLQRDRVLDNYVSACYVSSPSSIRMVLKTSAMLFPRTILLADNSSFPSPHSVRFTGGGSIPTFTSYLQIVPQFLDSPVHTNDSCSSSFTAHAGVIFAPVYALSNFVFQGSELKALPSTDTADLSPYEASQVRGEFLRTTTPMITIHGPRAVLGACLSCSLGSNWNDTSVYTAATPSLRLHASLATASSANVVVRWRLLAPRGWNLGELSTKLKAAVSGSEDVVAYLPSCTVTTLRDSEAYPGWWSVPLAAAVARTNRTTAIPLALLPDRPVTLAVEAVAEVRIGSGCIDTKSVPIDGKLGTCRAYHVSSTVHAIVVDPRASLSSIAQFHVNTTSNSVATNTTWWNVTAQVSPCLFLQGGQMVTQHHVPTAASVYVQPVSGCSSLVNVSSVLYKVYKPVNTSTASSSIILSRTSNNTASWMEVPVANSMQWGVPPALFYSQPVTGGLLTLPPLDFDLVDHAPADLLTFSGNVSVNLWRQALDILSLNGMALVSTSCSRCESSTIIPFAGRIAVRRSGCAAPTDPCDAVASTVSLPTSMARPLLLRLQAPAMLYRGGSAVLRILSDSNPVSVTWSCRVVAPVKTSAENIFASSLAVHFSGGATTRRSDVMRNSFESQFLNFFLSNSSMYRSLRHRDFGPAGLRAADISGMPISSPLPVPHPAPLVWSIGSLRSVSLGVANEVNSLVHAPQGLLLGCPASVTDGLAAASLNKSSSVHIALSVDSLPLVGMSIVASGVLSGGRTFLAEETIAVPMVAAPPSHVASMHVRGSVSMHGYTATSFSPVPSLYTSFLHSPLHVSDIVVECNALHLNSSSVTSWYAADSVTGAIDESLTALVQRRIVRGSRGRSLVAIPGILAARVLAGRSIALRCNVTDPTAGSSVISQGVSVARSPSAVPSVDPLNLELVTNSSRVPVSANSTIVGWNPSALLHASACQSWRDGDLLFQFFLLDDRRDGLWQGLPGALHRPNASSTVVNNSVESANGYAWLPISRLSTECFVEFSPIPPPRAYARAVAAAAAATVNLTAYSNASEVAILAPPVEARIGVKVLNRDGAFTLAVSPPFHIATCTPWDGAVRSPRSSGTIDTIHHSSTATVCASLVDTPVLSSSVSSTIGALDAVVRGSWSTVSLASGMVASLSPGSETKLIASLYGVAAAASETVAFARSVNNSCNALSNASSLQLQRTVMAVESAFCGSAVSTLPAFESSTAASLAAVALSRFSVDAISPSAASCLLSSVSQSLQSCIVPTMIAARAAMDGVSNRSSCTAAGTPRQSDYISQLLASSYSGKYATCNSLNMDAVRDSMQTIASIRLASLSAWPCFHRFNVTDMSRLDSQMDSIINAVSGVVLRSASPASATYAVVVSVGGGLYYPSSINMTDLNRNSVNASRYIASSGLLESSCSSATALLAGSVEVDSLLAGGGGFTLNFSVVTSIHERADGVRALGPLSDAAGASAPVTDEDTASKSVPVGVVTSGCLRSGLASITLPAGLLASNVTDLPGICPIGGPAGFYVIAPEDHASAASHLVHHPSVVVLARVEALDGTLSNLAQRNSSFPVLEAPKVFVSLDVPNHISFQHDFVPIYDHHARVNVTFDESTISLRAGTAQCFVMYRNGTITTDASVVNTSVDPSTVPYRWSCSVSAGVLFSGASVSVRRVACLDATFCNGRGSCHNNGASCKCLFHPYSGFWDSSNFCHTCVPQYYPISTALTNTSCKTFCGQFTCSGHGACTVNGTCACHASFLGASDCSLCTRNYYGPHCNHYCESTNTCGAHGICDDNGLCLCRNSTNVARTGVSGVDSGSWSGDYCTRCADGYSGRFCNVSLACGAGKLASLPNSTCLCRHSGWNLSSGCSSCNAGFVGTDCEFQCPARGSLVCSGHGSCSFNSSGSFCTCSANASAGFWSAETGCSRCAPGWIGADCTHQACHNSSCVNGRCDSSGRCICYASHDKGFFVESSNCTSCASGWTGSRCNINASCSLRCDSVGGSCDSGVCVCRDGHMPVDGLLPCSVCVPGRFRDATSLCSVSCDSTNCSNAGVCTQTSSGAVCRCYSDSLRGYYNGSTCATCADGYVRSSIGRCTDRCDSRTCSGHGSCTGNTSVCTCDGSWITLSPFASGGLPVYGRSLGQLTGTTVALPSNWLFGSNVINVTATQATQWAPPSQCDVCNGFLNASGCFSSCPCFISGGNCFAGQCLCHSSPTRGYWSGPLCSVCAPGWAGALCQQRCDNLTCSGHGECVRDSRVCSCNGNWTSFPQHAQLGRYCSACVSPFSGDHCNSTCTAADCSYRGSCSATGSCTCASPWFGDNCSTCAFPYSGPNCNIGSTSCVSQNDSIVELPVVISSAIIDPSDMSLVIAYNGSVHSTYTGVIPCDRIFSIELLSSTVNISSRYHHQLVSTARYPQIPFGFSSMPFCTLEHNAGCAVVRLRPAATDTIFGSLHEYIQNRPIDGLLPFLSAASTQSQALLSADALHPQSTCGVPTSGSVPVCSGPASLSISIVFSPLSTDMCDDIVVSVHVVGSRHLQVNLTVNASVAMPEIPYLEVFAPLNRTYIPSLAGTGIRGSQVLPLIEEERVVTELSNVFQSAAQAVSGMYRGGSIAQIRVPQSSYFGQLTGGVGIAAFGTASNALTIRGSTVVSAQTSRVLPFLPGQRQQLEISPSFLEADENSIVTLRAQAWTRLSCGSAALPTAAVNLTWSCLNHLVGACPPGFAFTSRDSVQTIDLSQGFTSGRRYLFSVSDRSRTAFSILQVRAAAPLVSLENSWDGATISHRHTIVAELTSSSAAVNLSLTPVIQRLGAACPLPSNGSNPALPGSCVVHWSLCEDTGTASACPVGIPIDSVFNTTWAMSVTKPSWLLATAFSGLRTASSDPSVDFADALVMDTRVLTAKQLEAAAALGYIKATATVFYRGDAGSSSTSSVTVSIAIVLPTAFVVPALTQLPVASRYSVLPATSTVVTASDAPAGSVLFWTAAVAPCDHRVHLLATGPKFPVARVSVLGSGSPIAVSLWVVPSTTSLALSAIGGSIVLSDLAGFDSLGFVLDLRPIPVCVDTTRAATVFAVNATNLVETFGIIGIALHPDAWIIPSHNDVGLLLDDLSSTRGREDISLSFTFYWSWDSTTNGTLRKIIANTTSYNIFFAAPTLLSPRVQRPLYVYAVATTSEGVSGPIVGPIGSILVQPHSNVSVVFNKVLSDVLGAAALDADSVASLAGLTPALSSSQRAEMAQAIAAFSVQILTSPNSSALPDKASTTLLQSLLSFSEQITNSLLVPSELQLSSASDLVSAIVFGYLTHAANTRSELNSQIFAAAVVTATVDNSTLARLLAVVAATLSSSNNATLQSTTLAHLQNIEVMARIAAIVDGAPIGASATAGTVQIKIISVPTTLSALGGFYGDGSVYFPDNTTSAVEWWHPDTLAVTISTISGVRFTSPSIVMYGTYDMLRSAITSVDIGSLAGEAHLVNLHPPAQIYVSRVSLLSPWALPSFSCAYYDTSANIWTSLGSVGNFSNVVVDSDSSLQVANSSLSNVVAIGGKVTCYTTHLTEFGVLLGEPGSNQPASVPVPANQPVLVGASTPGVASWLVAVSITIGVILFCGCCMLVVLYLVGYLRKRAALKKIRQTDRVNVVHPTGELKTVSVEEVYREESPSPAPLESVVPAADLSEKAREAAVLALIQKPQYLTDGGAFSWVTGNQDMDA